MLQRAASNAYTWWWASNIRSKQSKWLDNDLQEMEERVKSMVKLIEEDADSFAKKAEMYYKRRPELISRVEETFKAYKALADRYDRISGELHKANHTIATVLPDQVQFMEDEDDDRPPKEMSRFMSMSPPDSTKLPKPPPDLPRIIPRGMASDAQQATKKMHHVRVASFQEIPENVKEEIDKLHKGILILQTEKEFFKSMYERGLARYWDIERQMTEMQEEVTRLQDEYGTSNMIEDDEARALIAATALKSCEDTLFTLREQQKRTVEAARMESRRIKEATHKLSALKGEEEDSEEAADKDAASISSAVEEEIESLKNERMELQSICPKVKEHFQLCSDSSVVELAEKIDELVDKVINLEVIVSSQTAQIERLRSETDELHKYLRGLEEEKASPTWDSDSMNERLKQAEENLQRIQNLERSVHQEKGALRLRLKEVCHSLNDLSEKLQSPKPMEKSNTEEDDQVIKNTDLDNIENVDKIIQDEEGEKKLIKSQECLIEESTEGDKDWEQLLMNGFDGNEKILLLKCASIIRNYKETKMMLMEIDKKNQECHSETMQQIQELRNANAVKDEEIRALRQRLFSSESWRTRSMKKTASHHVQKLEELVVAPDLELGTSDELAKEVVKICHSDQSTTAIEDKFRADIDTLLEENLDFWLRFSTSYHQIQKFESKFKELQAEIEKVREAKNSSSVDDNISLEEAMMQNKIPTDKKLRELNTELQVWLEQNGLLQGELRSRFSSLCSIQEEIARASKENSDGDGVQQFTRYQAAKFQGEVINMQQENNKVAKELQTGLDHVRGLQVEVGRALSLLHQSFELSVTSKRNHHPIHQFRHLSTKSRIPLRTFLFGVKPKKPSLFSCMNPVYQKHHSDTRHGGVHKRS